MERFGVSKSLEDIARHLRLSVSLSLSLKSTRRALPSSSALTRGNLLCWCSLFAAHDGVLRRSPADLALVVVLPPLRAAHATRTDFLKLKLAISPPRFSWATERG